MQQARAGIAYLWVEVCGYPAQSPAPPVGVQPAAVLKSAHSGAREPARWRAFLPVDR